MRLQDFDSITQFKLSLIMKLFTGPNTVELLPVNSIIIYMKHDFPYALLNVALNVQAPLNSVNLFVAKYSLQHNILHYYSLTLDII